MNKFLPYGRQWISKRDVGEVVKILKDDWLTQGPRIKKFEEAAVKFTGAKFAVALSSGTAALHAACFAADIRPKNEVIITPITFIASSNCILYSGGKPIFADIKEDTCNINPEAIEQSITDRTKAIIPIDFAGQPVDLEEINAIAKKHNLIVIEDASHALGAEYRGRKIGSLSDLTTFSFHPIKQITTGEGGMVTTNREDFYEKMLMFRNHGIVKKKSRLKKFDGSWYYEMQELGYNYRITDFQCALGISQLKRINRFIQRRQEIAEEYNEAFRDIKDIILPYQKPEIRSAWHIYPIRLKLNRLRLSRKEVFEILRRNNLGVQVHYIPIYYHPYYQQLGYKKGLCPKAEKFYEETITLPLFPKMKHNDVKNVIKIIRKVIIWSRK